MPLPDCLVYQVGGTLTYNGSPTKPATARVRILDGSGSEKLASTAANISSIDAILVAAVTAGDWSASVNSNVGISQGDTLYIQDDPEELLVRKVAGTTVSFRRPAMKDHVNAAPVEGVTLSYAVNSATANSLWWDGHAEWNLDGSVYDKTAVHCTKYPMRAVYPTDQEVLDVIPTLARGKPEQIDMERLRRKAADRVMSLITSLAPDQRAHTFAGSDSFRHAAALMAAMLYYMPQRGEENRELYDRFREEAETEVKRMVLAVPRDADQDGDVEADERISPMTIRLVT